LQKRIASHVAQLSADILLLDDALHRDGFNLPTRAETRRQWRTQGAPTGFWISRRPCGVLEVGASLLDHSFMLDGLVARLLELLCTPGPSDDEFVPWKAWDFLADELGKFKPGEGAYQLTRVQIRQHVYRLRRQLEARGINPEAVMLDTVRGGRFALMQNGANRVG
jgi:hypothetical protein